MWRTVRDWLSGAGPPTDGGRRSAHPPVRLDDVRIDFDVDAQLDLLRGLEAPGPQEMFAALRSDPALSPDADGSSALVRNPYFPTPDAELYAAMIVRERPRRIVEVGSGYSTLVARRALDHAGLACELRVVDPEPRVDVSDAADVVEARRVEDGGLEVEAGTLLFLDSSHRMEPGTDGPYLYHRLLPTLPAGVLVHVHDIYLPYDYPAVYVGWGYAEQPALRALLEDGDRWRVVCAPYLLSREHPGAMRAAFGQDVARHHAFEGASMWLRTV